MAPRAPAPTRSSPTPARRRRASTTPRSGPSCSPRCRRLQERHGATARSTRRCRSRSTACKARFGAWYELFPRSWGGLEGGRGHAAGDRRPRLRRRSTCSRSTRSASTNRKGRNNTLTAGPDDPGSPIRDRRRARAVTTTCTPSSAPRRTSAPRAPPPASTAWTSRSTSRSSVGRPPVADRASGVVPPAPGRHAQVRREPAQALPGHLQRQLGQPRTGRRCGRRWLRRRPALGRPRRASSTASTTRTRSRSRSGSG